MKVIYEFNIDSEESDDTFDLSLHQHSFSLYSAIDEIQGYLTLIKKGWQDDNKEKIIEKIQNIISKSEFYLIEGLIV